MHELWGVRARRGLRESWFSVWLWRSCCERMSAAVRRPGSADGPGRPSAAWALASTTQVAADGDRPFVLSRAFFTGAYTYTYTCTRA
jgi:hypothetical protein